MKTAKSDNSSKVIKYVKDGRKIKQFGNYTFDTSNPVITAVKTVVNTTDETSTKINITFTYTEKANDSSNAVLKVQDAELKFTVQWGLPTRR